MKKLLLTFSLAAFLLSAKSQIIITGYLANPSGSDTNHEYVQLMATEDITFSPSNPYCLVTSRNGTTSAPNPSNYPLEGWATGGDRTYQINITVGTVQKGQLFYIGGSAKKINGPASTIIGDDKFIVAKEMTTAGDNGNGNAFGATAGMFPNSGRAAGIAVFKGTAISYDTLPLDVVFFRETNGGTFYTANNGNDQVRGYRVCENDKYNDGYYRDASGTNNFAFLNTGEADVSPYFSKLGGIYDVNAKEWVTARTLTWITLNNSSTLADIEGDGATTLPVTMALFTAKAKKQGTVNLVWATASEKNNSHFDVTRSVNGVDFDKIGEIKGAGNSDVVKNYSYTDANPSVGANYYRLKQVDFNGDFAYSQVAIAKVGLSNNNLAVSVANDKSSVAVNYNAITSGKAFFAIYNVTGAKLATVEKTVGVGNNQIRIPVQLGNSIHVLSVSQAGATASTKF